MRLKRLFLISSAAFLASAVPVFANKPTDRGIWLQEAATPVMEQLTWLHNFVSWIILAIVLFVMALMGYIMIRFNEKANPVPSKTTHHVGLEVAWTIVPIIILLVMVVPSMKLLYYQDALPETDMTIKVTGNTWSWEYAYPDFEDNVESYISNVIDLELSEKLNLSASEIVAKIDSRTDEDVNKGNLRLNGKPYLLATDAPLVVPVDTNIKVLVTSSANLHAFAVPAFGVKMDAVPGRINETWFEVLPGKEGTYYGQCSELCGVDHYKMPIEVEVVSKAEFNRWVLNGGSFTTDVAHLSGGLATAAQK